MSFLKKLFGGAEAKAPEPETHEGFLIFSTSQKDGGTFRLGARIEKEIGGDLKVHQMIRADTFQSEEAANEAAIRKAKMLIDQMGERLF
ncbi:MAG: hypothetical protein JXQ85_13695 [Cognatishimia sp.]|uniref:HlyU family transcriptional regulator n=1 Tax=Cognatishimia sp. TaxID=2211648 RepID=UPI003B8E9571